MWVVVVFGDEELDIEPAAYGPWLTQEPAEEYVLELERRYPWANRGVTVEALQVLKAEGGL